MVHALSFRVRAFAFSSVAAMALASMLATPVAAANNIKVHAEIGIGSFYGTNAGANNTVKILWRDSDGSLKSKQAVPSDSEGFWFSEPEEEAVEAGDTITTTVGSSTRTYTVKRLTVSVDRVADMVSGEAPANTMVLMELRAFEGRIFDPTYHQAATTADGSGHYEFDFSTGGDVADIQGWDGVQVVQRNARGDTTSYGLNVDAVRVWAGKARFDLVGDPGTSVNLMLSRSATTTSDVNVLIGPDAFLLNSSFVDNDGQRVRTQAGDDLTVSGLAPDASFTIPDIAISVAKFDDRVVANCGMGADRGVEVFVHDRFFFQIGDLYGRTNSSGNFVARFADQGVNIQAGFKIEVYCKFATGDIVVRVLTVE